MKINGTIFSKPQRDQLKRGIGAELDKVVAKVDDVDARMLNYTGDWVSGNEYHENDVVTYSGNLYEVIQSGTSNTTPDATPSMYKAMTNPSVNNALIPVYFDTQGGYFGASSTPENLRFPVMIQLIAKGTVCVQPTAPLKTGKDFDAWYLDPVDDSHEFSFLGTPINAPLVLYAHWV